MERNKRIYSLDLIKVIATFLILLTHYHQNFFGDYSYINYFKGKFYMGHIVELFFVLSGFFSFGMVKRIKDGEQFGSFFLKRVRRLLPIMVVAAIFDQILVAVYMKISGQLYSGRGLSLWGTIISAFGIQSWGVFFNQAVNNPTWYVSVLILCYVILFLTTYISKKTDISAVVYYSFVALIGAAALSREWNYPFINQSTARGYVAFFTGLIFAHVWHYFRLQDKKVVPIIALTYIVAFFCVFARSYSIIENDMRFLCVFTLWPSLIILMTCKPIRTITDFPFWGWLGNVSFDTYIWHANVIKCFYIFAAVKGTDALYTRAGMFIFCICSWIVGSVSYFLLEKPMDRLINKIITQKHFE